jgi:lysophospholipase L1-like esterase
MTTNLHTDIAGGAAATSAVVNAPLGQLDSHLSAILDTDDTLKAGAVDNATVLASGVVTTAKIAAGAVTSTELGALAVTNAKVAANAIDTTNIVALAVTGNKMADTTIAATKLQADALPMPNIMWDPFNTATRPGVSFDNLPRWHQAEELTLIYPDTANPYGTATAGGTLRFANASSTVAGKYLWKSELGLATSDVISLQMRARAASGTFTLACRAYNRAGTALGAGLTEGTGVTFSGTADFLTVSFTVPASTEYIFVGPHRTSGSAVDLDIFALWGNRGVYTGSTPGPTVALPSTIAAVPRVWGQHLLRDWRAALGKVRNASAGAQAVMVCLGDSWTERDDIWAPVRAALQTAYGDAGVGYVSATADGATRVDGWSHSRAGTWTDTDTGATALSVNLYKAVSTDTATPASITVASTGSRGVQTFKIHYYQQSGGGSFRYQVDGGAFTTVNTDNVSASVQTTTITGLSNADHTLKVEVTVAGSAGVTLLGVGLLKTGNGVRVARAGNAGSTVTDWITIGATPWEAALAALAPNLVTILLGTNDKTGNLTMNTYATGLGTLIDRIRAAMPRADILVLTPVDTGDTATYVMSDYVVEARRVAQTKNVALLNLYEFFDTFANNNARALMDATDVSGRHLSADGGKTAADVLLRELLLVV